MSNEQLLTNIVDDISDHEPEAGESLDYMGRFDVIDQTNNELKMNALQIGYAAYDSSRITVMKDCINMLVKQNEQMYNLLVEMHNHFDERLLALEDKK